MKKSLITFAVVLVAGLTQAASLSWNITNVPLADGDTSYTAMLFITEQAKDYGGTVTSIDTVTSYANEGKFDDLAALAVVNNSYEGNIVNKATGYNGNNFGAGDSLKGIAIIIDASKKNYFLTAEKSASWTSGTGAKTLGFASQANATWVPFGNSQPDQPDVPEPATGALALAGVALLFRRRR